MKKRTKHLLPNEALAEKLVWQAADRDDVCVANAIHEGKSLDGIYGLDEVGLLDEFWDFLEKVGAIKLLQNINGDGIERVMVPFFQFVMLYCLKVLFGIPSMHALAPLLFTNKAAMTLVGFNAHQIKNGICNRGKSKRKKELNKTGPICDDTLTRNIVKIPLYTMVTFFNGIVSCLAAFGIFPKNIWISIDGSDLPTTDRYEDCGKAVRKERIKDKTGRWQTVEVTVYGFKLLAVFYGELKIPLAAKVVKIQEYEGHHFLELLEQAQDNLAMGGVRIVGVVIDRGYLDGKDLWAIKKKGMHFVIPAKSGMDVHKDARAIALAGGKHRRWEAVRTEKVTQGIGKKARKVELETKLVGIVGLTTYAQYGEPGWQHESTKINGRWHPINAIVVEKWRGRDVAIGDVAVFLTDMPVRDPFVAFDRYDERSLIENCLFKEAKGPWNLKRFPAKSKSAVNVHVFFTLALMALTNSYRYWKSGENEKKKQQEENAWGIEQFRRFQRKESKDQAIVFIGEHYGIFYLAEMMVFRGLKVKDLPEGYSNTAEIFAKYSIAGAPP